MTDKLADLESRLSDLDSRFSLIQRHVLDMEEPVRIIRGALHTLHDISTMETIDCRVIAFIADSLNEPVARVEWFFADATKAGEADHDKEPSVT